MAIPESYTEAREMNDGELRNAIETLESRLEDMNEKHAGHYSPAKLEKRAELAAALGVFKNELEMRTPERPLTQPGPRGTGYRGGGKHFASAGEFYQAVARSATPGNAPDQRLYDVRAAAGGNELVPSEGGFLLQTDYSREILENVFETGAIAKLCRRIQISGNANSIKINGLDESSRANGSRWGGVTAGWYAETGEIAATKPTFRQIELNLKKMGILIYTTDEMLQDVSVLENVLTKIASDELSFGLEQAIINGSGAGQPLGVLASNAAVTVAKEAGQQAGTVLIENVSKMWQRMFFKSRQNAVWLINQNVESQLYTMSLQVGVGGSAVFMPAGGASAQPYMTLFGRPIIGCEHCPNVGSLGDIILADFAGGYLLAEKGGVQAASSIHVLFSTDQSVFRFTMRVDGCPVLSAPITTYQGGAGNTQSHFVLLAERA